MILKDDGNIKSESSQEDMFESDGHSSDEVSYEDDQTQRKNIFHSIYMVKGNCCLFIIDGSSSVNIASLRQVEKLCFPTMAHHKPYRL
ncbi:hypothetical protein CR513_61167, partial [Mucuna pruriens]